MESNEPQQRGSQVRACLERIEQEYLAGQRGLAGYAETSRHDFITARMENMQAGYVQLTAIVGDGDEAIRLVAEMLDQVQVEVRHAS